MDPTQDIMTPPQQGDPNAPPQPGTQSIPMGGPLSAENYFKHKIMPELMQRSLGSKGLEEMIIKALLAQQAPPTPNAQISGQIPQSPQVQFSTPRENQPVAAPQQGAPPSADMSVGAVGGAGVPATNPFSAMMNALTAENNNTDQQGQQNQNAATLAALQNNPSNIPSLY